MATDYSLAHSRRTIRRCFRSHGLQSFHRKVGHENRTAQIPLLARAHPAAHARVARRRLQRAAKARRDAPSRRSRPQAVALGYKHDASKVDKKKFANFKDGETCANCLHFTGKAGDPWGPCALFPGKQVNAKGWCSAWVKKA
jgi:hypothetical protein